jgi:ribosomal protein S18 acetylase RimI-like enzyme
VQWGPQLEEGASVSAKQATIEDLDDLVPLFDGYRQFYGQESDLSMARSFLQERFKHNESIIFIARDKAGVAVGFTQLYPSFTSTGCARIYILNDLFVTTGQRGKHFGLTLLSAAEAFGRRMGAVRLTLSTAVDNTLAQGVYAAAGWKRSDAFITYNLAL